MTSPTEATSLSDEEIVLRVLAGESALFELLMRRNNRRVYRAARGIVRDDREAEDVMQDAYVRAYEHLQSFDHRARFSTWLVRIAVNEALARIRRAKKHEPIDLLPEHDLMPRTPAMSPETLASDGEMRDVLERAIGSLSDDFRVVFMLRAVEEMSVDDTASVLSVRPDVVKTRYLRARAMLREDLHADVGADARHAYAFAGDRCDAVVAAVLDRLRERHLIRER